MPANDLPSRRSFLRTMGLGAGAAAVAGSAGELLEACSSSGSPARAKASSSVTSTSGPAPAPGVHPYDARVPFWEQGNFAAVKTEVTQTELPITGTVPSALRGLYVRNGSNPASGKSPHWFLGDGMVHGVRIQDGKALWYRNRYVQTDFYKSKTDFAGIPGKKQNQSNVAIVRHAGRLMTLGEVGWPYEISADDLHTIGAWDFNGKAGPTMTAHPKIDPVTGHLHFFGYNFVKPYLTYYEADATGALIRSEEVAVKGPTMIHDFAITDRDVIFWEGPVVFGINPGLPQMPYVWQESYGSRVGVMPLGGPASAIRWVEMPASYVFHGTNAHRDGQNVVLHVSKLDWAFKGNKTFGPSALHRWTIDTSGDALRLTDDKVNDTTMDLPTVDRRYTGRKNQFGFYAMVDNHGPYGMEFSGVKRVDLASGATQTWQPPDWYRPGEVFVVPENAKSGEAEGWLLTYAYDRTRDRSDLVVLDATDVGKGPVAKVHLPVRVPYGFHGLWVGDA